MKGSMHRSRSRLLGLLAALAALPWAASGAAATDREPVARLAYGPAAIEWHALVEHEGLALTVSSPDGQVFERRFAAGETPAWNLFDRAGSALPDGVYGYELRVQPRLSAETRAALAAARESGDETALAALRATGQLVEGAVQSGTFEVRGGAFAAPGEAEPGGRPNLAPRAPGAPGLALRDFVIADDLIVQGSTCVGFDCVNGEAFSFDTIRLKENSTRLTFIDTSAAGFPQGDWQIRANDSSGSANKLTIDWLGTGAADGDTPTTTPFTVEGSATTNSVYVDSTGRIGFRTSTPVLDLHVSTSNTPALRLEQNNSGGFTAQTWDVAGNEANFFVRDVTGGSTLPFRIRPGAPSNSIDIAADGNVGIGTTGAEDFAHIVGDTDTTGGLTIASRGTGLSQLSLVREDAAGADLQVWRFRVNTPGQFVFTDATNGVSPFRINNAAGASDRLVITNAGVEVTGTLRVNGVQMNVPDFVFQPDYKLMPLDELASFVAENRHLPNVPNAEQVKAQGLDLSQFPLQILEKVEELTLYTLAQHRTIGELSAQNAELARRLAALEAALQASP
jgi:hypothetical protein